MADTREDEGEVYPGGRVIPKRRMSTRGGDMRHEEFSTIEALVGKTTMNQIIAKVNEVLGVLKG